MPKGNQVSSGDRHLQTVRLDEVQLRKIAAFSALKTRETMRSVSFNLAITMLIDELPDPDKPKKQKKPQKPEATDATVPE